MSKYFEKVVDFAAKMSLDIVHQNSDDQLIVVTNEDKGIYQMVIDCEFPILVIEQLIYEIKNRTQDHFLELLKMNRNLIHGAFVVDQDEKQVIFRDTLQLENLDFNELEGTINALSLGLAEYSGDLLRLNQQ
ncbi:MAG: YbjN domain-containing protein [Proteobacteria bacterium]|nr:YbjN domain-containing protein [Pseudomonadota bacterium]